MRIEKEKTDFGTNDINLFNEISKFSIMFGGNGDLYWQICDLRANAKNYEEFEGVIQEFVIDKSNEKIFNSFMNLYNNIIGCKFLDGERLYLKESEEYKKLVNDGVITWSSDEIQEELADKVEISLDGESIKVRFIPGKEDENMFKLPASIPIRFRNSGSRYKPFNLLFLDHYNNIQEIEPEYIEHHDNSQGLKLN